MKCFVLTDYILSRTLVFSISVLCFQIFTVKLILWSKMGLIYAISIVNWIFWKNFIRNYFLLFFTDFKVLIFINNIVKISEIMNKWNLLKTAIKAT